MGSRDTLCLSLAGYISIRPFKVYRQNDTHISMIGSFLSIILTAQLLSTQVDLGRPSTARSQIWDHWGEKDKISQLRLPRLMQLHTWHSHPETPGRQMEARCPGRAWRRCGPMPRTRDRRRCQAWWSHIILLERWWIGWYACTAKMVSAILHGRGIPSGAG